MKLISQLINNRKERIQRSMQRKETLLQDEYAERVQAKEYNGKMYIAIDGIPFIQADNIKADIVKALTDIRQTIIQYKTK